MKRFLLAAGASLMTASAPQAFAQTLEEALSAAYNSNPTIAAERARQRATRQQTPQAIANALPQVTGAASFIKNDTTTTLDNRFFGVTTPPTRVVESKFDTTSYQVSGEQPIFTGFRNFNAIRAARARVKAGAAELALVEQDVLTRAAGAYFDVVRDMEVFAANTNNVDVLIRQKREADLRFEVGEVTKTDVAQSEARLAQARANLTTAQARLAVSRATFVEIIGDAPSTLEDDPVLPAVPETLEAALSVSREGAPSIVRARMAERAQRRNVQVARGALSPTISLTAQYQFADQPSISAIEDEQFAYGARATVPIFLGGLNISRVREAKALHDQSRRQVEEAERRADAAVTGAFEQLQAGRANIRAATSQVAASELALNGVRREAQLGVRTTLDVLDAEQEFLNAKVSLANAERDTRLSTFQLLAAMGALGPDVEDMAGQAP
ncbi:MAG: TolC family outer membrane protein [Parvularculaceae bacterium]|nr:TolC family outer membrane protein [Parvularculaceae bacterium]